MGRANGRAGSSPRGRAGRGPSGRAGTGPPNRGCGKTAALILLVGLGGTLAGLSLIAYGVWEVLTA